MGEMSWSWSWVSLLLLGAFHGLNPAMGWLFAVARGFQERRLRAVVAALGPIALGHALSIGVVAVVVGLLGLVVPSEVLLVLGGVALLAFAGYKVATRFRHPRWVGMRVGSRDLVLWSFLMATAHGAGLMLVPVLARLGEREVAVVAAGHEDHTGHAAHMAHLTQTGHAAHVANAADGLGGSVAAVGLHTAAMFLVMGVLAILVYRKLGVEVLRRAWVNLDFVWVGALTTAGAITLGVGLWSLLPV
jgi:hypothetical protein